MTLQPREVGAVVDELRATVASGRLQNLHQVGTEAFVLSLRVGRENRWIYLSAERGAARLHLVTRREPGPKQPPEFCTRLRRWLKGRVLRDVSRVESDRIARLEFAERSQDVDGLGASLILEMLPRYPNLIVVDGDDRILGSLNPVIRDREALRSGEKYIVPARPARPAHRDEETGVPFEDHESASAAIEARYADRVSDQARAAVDRLRREVKKELERRTRVLDSIEADFAKARERQQNRKLGEVLKASMGQWKRGQTSVELVDYFSEDLRKVTIALDPVLSPVENVEKYFKTYRKAQRAIPFLEGRRAEIEEQRQGLLELQKALEPAESPEDVEEITNRLSRFKKSKGRKRSRTKVQVAVGPRRFLSVDGYEIWVGRNSKQNDELTLKLARGNDVFLHVAGRPGAHVILRKQPGKDVPFSSLVDAAMLALYYSFTKRSSGELIGARGEVDYAPVKYVSKPKGAKPGAVLLASHKSLRVEIEERAFAELRRRSDSID